MRNKILTGYRSHTVACPARPLARPSGINAGLGAPAVFPFAIFACSVSVSFTSAERPRLGGWQAVGRGRNVKILTTLRWARKIFNIALAFFFF